MRIDLIHDPKDRLSSRGKTISHVVLNLVGAEISSKDQGIDAIDVSVFVGLEHDAVPNKSRGSFGGDFRKAVTDNCAFVSFDLTRLSASLKDKDDDIAPDISLLIEQPNVSIQWDSAFMMVFYAE